MKQKKTGDIHSFKIILSKAQHYCAYQERCIQDIRKKLNNWSLQKEFTEKIIKKLLEEKYIDEERFAKTFAGGKFRINKWGRNRIINELKKRQIPDLYIQIAIEEIDDDTYLKTLKAIILKKLKGLKVEDKNKCKQKAARYAISKGYETDLIWKILRLDFVNF